MLYLLAKSLIPVFCILFLGYRAGVSKVVDRNGVHALNVFLMDFALPSALFLSTIQAPWKGIVSQLPLAMSLTLSMWVIYGFMVVISTHLFKLRPDSAAVLALTTALPNFAALGLPILGSDGGSASTAPLSVAVAISCGALFLSPLCLAILEQERQRQAGFSEDQGGAFLLFVRLGAASFKKPIVFAPLLGALSSALLWVSHLAIPELVLGAFRPLGAAALGTALFVTGVILSSGTFRVNGVVLVSGAIKNLALPCVAFVIARSLGGCGHVLRAAILLSALSSGFFGVLFGLRYGVSSTEAESTLLLSTVAFAFTLPIFILLSTGIR